MAVETCDWLTYFLIPWVAGVVGWYTNVMALLMTFYPIEFLGYELWRLPNEPWGLFGWQGIIPAKAEKMASTCFDLFTRRLFSVQEVFDRLDPVAFSNCMEQATLLLLDQVIDEVAREHMPSVWNSLPQAVKDDIVLTTDTESSAFLGGFIEDMKEHIDDVLDIKDLAVSCCVARKELIVKIFQECGDKEFNFIRQSGFYFGFFFGLFQSAAAYRFADQDYFILPLAGFMVGWVTNYLALKVIFRPLQPVKFLGVSVQGIFLKRQEEVSEIFARVIMTEILNVKAIWNAIFTGPLHKNFFAILRAHTIAFVDKLVVEVRPLIVAALGAEAFNQLKEDIAQKVIQKLPNIIDHSYAYTQQALDMENTVRTRMQELSSEEFEGVLHPAFEEDEIQLIMVGGMLGAVVGGLQYMVFREFCGS